MEAVTAWSWFTSHVKGYSVGCTSIRWEEETGEFHTCRVPLELPDWGPLPKIECYECGTSPHSELMMRELWGQLLMSIHIEQQPHSIGAVHNCNFVFV